MRKRRIVLVLLAVALLGVVAALLYLRFGDLSVFRDNVERSVSRILGRELTIGGAFEPRISLVSTLVAGGVELADSGSPGATPMARVEHLEGSVDLWSLISGPIRIPRLAVRGGRVALELREDGSANWQFDLSPSDADSGRELDEPPVIFEQVLLEDVSLSYRAPGLPRPIELRVSRFEARLVDGGMIEVTIDGQLDGRDLVLRGGLGSYGPLWTGGEVRCDLECRFGDVSISFAGEVQELKTLGDPRLELAAAGPDVSELTERFGLPPLDRGAFELSARTVPSAGAIDTRVEARLGQLTFDLQGRLDRLIAADEVEFRFDASGPDLAAAGGLVGFERLPGGGFDLSGNVAHDSSSWTFEDLRVTVGEHRLSADGTLGAAPRFPDTDFSVSVEGDELSDLESLAGTVLPAGAYSLSGRLVRQEGHIVLEEVQARMAGADLRIDGTVGDAPAFVGTRLEVRGTGPHLSAFSGVARVELPALPFEIDGRLAYDASGLSLAATTARVGRHELTGEGALGQPPRMVGADLRFRLGGGDLSEVGELFGSDEWPAEPYRTEGRFRIFEDGYGLDSIRGAVGRATVQADGRLGAPPDFRRTDLRLSVAGPDLSWVAEILGAPDLPTDPFDLSGGLGVAAEGFRLHSVEGIVGNVELSLDGIIGRSSDLEGTDLHVDVRGPRLSAVAEYLPVSSLPDEPFSVSGGLAIDEHGYVLTSAVGRLGAIRVAADGRLGPLPEMLGSDIQFDGAGEDLAEVSRLARESDLDWPDLPQGEFALSGRACVEQEAHYRLENVEGHVAGARWHLDGTLVAVPRLVGTDLSVEAQGNDASPWAAMAGVEVPAAPFRLQGRFERLDHGLRFRGTRVELGDHRAALEGSLGDPPDLVGTRLDVEVKGPSFAELQEFGELPPLPDAPYDVAAHVEGRSGHFTLDGLRARVGAQDLRGRMSLHLEGTPELQANLESDRLDLSTILARDPASQEPNEAIEEKSAKKKPRREFVIPTDPLFLDDLDELNGDVRWKVGELLLPMGPASDLELSLHLRAGRLELDRFAVTGERGSRVTGEFSLIPVRDAHHLYVQLNAHELHLDRPGKPNQEEKPPTVDLEVDLDGVGKSLHEIAASASGHVLVIVSAGRIEGAMLDLLGADVLMRAGEFLNPFDKNAQRTAIDCGVLAIQAEDGLAQLGPLALQTERTTIVGSGTVRLDTEKLNLEWISKPRKGVGLSASAVTNSYLKLGGTLGEPAVEIKPLEAVTTTGVAVATLGLSIVAKGMWNRVTAEKKVCKRALKAIEAQAAARQGVSAERESGEERAKGRPE